MELRRILFASLLPSFIESLMVLLFVILVYLELSDMVCALSCLLQSAIFFPKGMTFLGKGMNTPVKEPANLSRRACFKLMVQLNLFAISLSSSLNRQALILIFVAGLGAII